MGGPDIICFKMHLQRVVVIEISQAVIQLTSDSFFYSMVSYGVAI